MSRVATGPRRKERSADVVESRRGALFHRLTLDSKHKVDRRFTSADYRDWALRGEPFRVPKSARCFHCRTDGRS